MPKFNACAFGGCGSVKSREPDLTFHRFPKDDDTRRKWLDQCCNKRIENLSSTQINELRVCSKHFTATDFEAYGSDGKRRIRKTAIPLVGSNISTVSTGVDFQPQQANITSDFENSSEIILACGSKTISDSLSALPSNLTNNVKDSCSRVKGYKIVTARESRQAQVLKTLRYKIKLYQKKIKRLEAQIKKESPFINAGKSLNSLNENQQAFFEMQIKHQKQRPWSDEEQQFAISIFYISPKAYGYLRDKKQFALPCTTLIKRWINSLNVCPGISSGIFDPLKLKVATMSVLERDCVLIWDEMSLQKLLEYNRKADLVEGFQDLGELGRTSGVANNALVFLLRGLIYPWQQPLAFVVSHGPVNYENLHQLTASVIDITFSIGLNIRAVVCDQGSANRALATMLGVTVEKPFFERENRKIFYIFDPPHLIKSTRNNLEKKDFEIDGEKISWGVYRELLEVMKRSVSRAAPKLTERHIAPNNFQRMNVSLATQVFSATVSAALNTGMITGDIKHPACAATANFTKRLNDLFDCMNSRGPSDPNPLKRAMSSAQPQVETCLREGVAWIKKWSIPGSKLPPCFSGLVITINAILGLWKDMESGGFRYLITSRLQQDPIENLFGIYRRHGGDNYNPSPMMLRRIFQASAKVNLMRPLTGTNCEADESMAVLLGSGTTPSSVCSVSDGRSELDKKLDAWAVQEPIIGSLTDDIGINDRIEELKKIEFSECSDSSVTVVTLEECTMTYVAGYLAYKCLKQFNCSECRVNLTKNNQNMEKTNELLIFWKAYKCKDEHELGNLKVPSDNFNKVVTTMYEVFMQAFTAQPHRLHIARHIETCVNTALSNQHGDYWTLEGGCGEHRSYIVELFVRVHIHYQLKWMSWDLRDRNNVNKRTSACSEKPNRKLMKLSHQ